MSEPASTSFAGIKFVNNFELNLLDWYEYHLRNPLGGLYLVAC